MNIEVAPGRSGQSVLAISREVERRNKTVVSSGSWLSLEGLRDPDANVAQLVAACEALSEREEISRGLGPADRSVGAYVGAQTICGSTISREIRRQRRFA